MGGMMAIHQATIPAISHMYKLVKTCAPDKFVHYEGHEERSRRAATKKATEDTEITEKLQ